jgi:peptidoglycan hydrolase CwlO-like protein
VTALALLVLAVGCGLVSDQGRREAKKKVEAKGQQARQEAKKKVDEVQTKLDDVQTKLDDVLKKVDELLKKVDAQKQQKQQNQKK